MASPASSAARQASHCPQSNHHWVSQIINISIFPITPSQCDRLPPYGIARRAFQDLTLQSCISSSGDSKAAYGLTTRALPVGSASYATVAHHEWVVRMRCACAYDIRLRSSAESLRPIKLLAACLSSCWHLYFCSVHLLPLQVPLARQFFT